MSGRRLEALDALRGIAALMVLVCHVAILDPAALGPAAGFAAGGRVGVLVFFVLSGYLLYRPFVAGDWNVRSYLVRRLLRIYPAYLVALVGVTLLSGSQAFLDHPAEFLLFAQNYDPRLFNGFLGVSWTLQLEMGFYLLLPGIALLARGRELRVVAGLGLVSFGASVVVLYDLSGGLANRAQVVSLLPFFLWAFVPGMLLAILDVRGRLGIFRNPLWVIPGAQLVLLGVAFAIWASVDLVTTAGAMLLVAWCVARRPALGPWAAWAGGLSYAIYLWHEDVIRAVLRLGPTGAPAAVLALALTLVVAAVSYLVVERPAIALGRRLTRRRAAVVATAEVPQPAVAPAGPGGL